jgi:hypothetical protein
MDEQRILREIDDATHDTATVDPAKVAGELNAYILRLCEDQRVNISDHVVDRLIDLLSSPNDVVRGYAASSLGALLPKSCKALPALELAVHKSEQPAEWPALRPAVTSAKKIRDVIKQMNCSGK